MKIRQNLLGIKIIVCAIGLVIVNILLLSYSLNYFILFNCCLISIFFIIYLSVVNPKKLLLVSISSLVVSMDRIFPVFDFMFFQKILILYSCLLCIFRYGWKRVTKISILLLVVLLAISLTLIPKTGNYSNIDLITSFTSILLGILVFFIKWNKDESLGVLRLLSKLPLISLGIGLIFTFIGIHPIINPISNRLQGATISTHFVMASTIALVASLTLYYIDSTKTNRYMVLLNYILSLATLSRGGIIFSTIILLPYIFINIVNGLKSNMKFLKRVYILILLIPILIYFGLNIFERSFSNGELNTSNRVQAWEILLKLSEDSRLIGLGIGYIKTIEDPEIADRGFNAAHNEYIRLLVESGWVGIILIFCSLFSYMSKIPNDNIANKKSLIILFYIGFMIYSFTDNTISAVQFWVPFNLYLGIVYNKGNKVEV
ncbi:O-antigen ligase family protein [Caldifermentibacillus hisashii]|uniref:O-antigen ligase family protein n=1 Tax=Caldifermentibacillus hisashii TaxID=996558 RepID=UPI0030D6493C